MLHHASRQLCPVLVMNLFGGIHFPVGFGQKLFRVRAILRVKHCPQARRQHIRRRTPRGWPLVPWRSAGWLFR